VRNCEECVVIFGACRQLLMMSYVGSRWLSIPARRSLNFGA